jgi:hypothetical protein
MIYWRFLRCLPVLLLLATTSGCSALTPFLTGPLALSPGMTDPGPRVALCYNPLKTSPEQLLQLAQVECVGDVIAERIDTDYRLDNCPLMTPGRATFLCKSKAK